MDDRPRPFEEAWRRSPLAFLVEAADDACNRVIDLDDALRLRLVSFATADELLGAIIAPGGASPQGYNQRLDEHERIGYPRALAIGALIEQAAAVFKRSQDSR